MASTASVISTHARSCARIVASMLRRRGSSAFRLVSKSSESKHPSSTTARALGDVSLSLSLSLDVDAFARLPARASSSETLADASRAIIASANDEHRRTSPRRARRDGRLRRRRFHQARAQRDQPRGSRG